MDSDTAKGADLGQAFYVFALVLFPALVFLGLVTFERVFQSAARAFQSDQRL